MDRKLLALLPVAAAAIALAVGVAARFGVVESVAVAAIVMAVARLGLQLVRPLEE